MTFDTTSPWGTWKPQGLAAMCLRLIDALPPSGAFRKLAFLLRRPVKDGRQDVYDREIWGLKLRLAARGNLTEQRWLTMPRFHDPVERQALREALRPGGVFLDVGANAGFYSFWVLSLRLPDVKVIAVEPSPTMLARMRHNLAANHLQDSVRLFPCAVTDRPCEVVLTEHGGNLGQSGISENGTGPTVAGKPLIEILGEARVERVQAMKIDIEGHELPVLTAFYQQAPRELWPRLVIGEIVGNGGDGLRSLLTGLGYRVLKETKMNGILELPS